MQSLLFSLDSDNISSIGSPQTKSPGMDLSSSSSPSSPGETTNTSYPSTGSSPSSSRGEANSSTNSGKTGSLYCVSISVTAGGAFGDSGSYRQSNSRLIKFSVQRGARFDLKEEQLKEVSSKIGKLLRYRLYSGTSNGFDGFLGE